MSEMKSYAHYLTTTQFFALDHAVKIVVEAYRAACKPVSTVMGTYLVGSCLERANFRDVDVRMILSDEAFAQLFPTPKIVRLSSIAISEWLSARTGVPVDFQFQQMTDANEKYPGTRNAIGYGWNYSEFLAHERAPIAAIGKDDAK